MRALVLMLACAATLPGQEVEPKKSPLLRGATKESEAAVAKGLRWLALHQCADGSWSLDRFNRHARTDLLPKGRVKADDSTPEIGRHNLTGATAFALLPFLAAGHTHKAGAYQKPVQAGLNFLLKRQVQAGGEKGHLGNDLYAHALSLNALADAYRLTKDPAFKAPAQLGADYLVAAQLADGGWRCPPHFAGEVSGTVVVLRALAAARRAGLTVPKKAGERAARFLDAAVARTKIAEIIAEQESTPAITAAAAHGRLLLGTPSRDAAIQGAAKAIGGHRTAAYDPGQLHFAFHATLALYEAGGDAWTGWNEGRAGYRDQLVKGQDDGTKRAGNAGSWRGDDQVGGRLGATSFALLSLLVYHEGRGMAAKPEP